VGPRLNDFSSNALIAAIEESLRELWRNWGRAPLSELYDGSDMLRLYTGVPYAFCNGVICRQLSPDKPDDRIEETVSYYRDRNASWEWIVGPNSNPASLDEALERHGLVNHADSIGMGINLHAMNKEIPSIENFNIIQADDTEALKLWANTAVKGFEAPALYPAFVNLECSLGSSQPSYRHYLGLLDHQPVSTSALFLGERVAGIYCVSTLPAARRLGIGGAITLYALREAFEKGYHVAVLQSSPMGRNVYRRLGFQEFSILRGYSL
jgi:ribosomal protein S18 acetylase RimI-like enzyme